MKSTKLPVGSYIRIEKSNLQSLVIQLRSAGYRTVGPKLVDGAVIYDDLASVDELPIGYVDRQDGGFYRLSQENDHAYFDYGVGPHSLKNFLFPARDTLATASRQDGTWSFRGHDLTAEPLAVLGVRACDLRALAVQDRVFLKGDYVDPAYRARRKNLFVAAVNCRRAAATCFCHSMKCGPAVQSGFDLALTEVEDYFVMAIGSERGGEIASGTEWMPCAISEVERAEEVSLQLAKRMHQRSQDGAGGAGSPRARWLDTADIHDVLMDNLEHPRWAAVANRCLSCANCTMVCPTCFCSTVEEVSNLTGDEVRRERSWSSCFTADHSYMNSGTVRKTTRSRYRQWLTHKLATWIDQYGTSGCVGCGRCITWCPVGIDLTEEVAAIRKAQP